MLVAAKGAAQVSLDSLRVKGFIKLLPPQKQLSELKGRQVTADKVLVNLRQLGPQALQLADNALDLSPSQQLGGLQPVKSGDEGVPPIHGDGVEQANLGDAVRQLPDAARRSLSPPRIYLDFMDWDTHGATSRA